MIDGKQTYLGPIGSAKAAKEYRKIVNQWERQFGVKSDTLAVPENVKIITPACKMINSLWEAMPGNGE